MTDQELLALVRCSPHHHCAYGYGMLAAHQGAAPFGPFIDSGMSEAWLAGWFDWFDHRDSFVEARGK